MDDNLLSLALGASIGFGILMIATSATFLLTRLLRPPQWKRLILRRRREDISASLNDVSSGAEATEK